VRMSLAPLADMGRPAYPMPDPRRGDCRQRPRVRSREKRAASRIGYMSWFNFILALPVIGVGYVCQWVRDMFNRGRTLYDLNNE
jgi:hypothetical protein